MQMKITILTTFGNSFGKTLATSLYKQNYEISLVIEKPTFKARIRRALRHIKNKGFFKAFAIIRNFILAKIETANQHNNKNALPAQIRAYYVEDLNSKESSELLNKLNPDLMILGGTRIIGRHILKAPKKGAINCHPGLLPMFRGMDVIPWAILNKEEVGATVHYVNEGIDSGDIIMKKAIKTDDCNSLAEVREKVKNLSYDLLLKSIRLIESGKARRVKQKKKYRVYTKMPKRLLMQVDDMIKNGHKNKH